MKAYISGDCKVLTKNGCRKIVTLPVGSVFRTPLGACTALSIDKIPRQLSRVTIDTYAGVKELTVVPTAMCLTEGGWKRFFDLKKGDALTIKGRYVPYRHSVIRKISYKACKVCYGYSIETEYDAVVVNDIVLKTR